MCLIFERYVNDEIWIDQRAMNLAKHNDSFCSVEMEWSNGESNRWWDCYVKLLHSLVFRTYRWFSLILFDENLWVWIHDVWIHVLINEKKLKILWNIMIFLTCTYIAKILIKILSTEILIFITILFVLMNKLWTRSIIYCINWKSRKRIKKWIETIITKFLLNLNKI